MNKQELHQEYQHLDEKLTDFRKRWNAAAQKDTEYAMTNHTSKGAQGDFPEWWYRDVDRWRELRRILNIRR